jgi:hypothetical protein
MEAKVTAEEKIYSFLQKNGGSKFEVIESGTGGIFKLNIHKALKKLIEGKKIAFNAGDKTYKIVGEGVQATKNNKVAKERDEARLPNNGKRDTAKFLFNKVLYPKSRAALNVLKFHIAKNPRITLPIVQSLFKDIKSRYGILVPLAEAEKHAKISGRYRHFVKPEDLIVLQGRKMACNNQWDQINFNQFCIICKTLKYEIKKQQ